MDNDEALKLMENVEYVRTTVGGLMAALREGGLRQPAAECVVLKQMGVEVVFHADSEGGEE